MILVCIRAANDNPRAPCHDRDLEERVWAGGSGAIVLCCPECETVYRVLTEAGQWIAAEPGAYV